ncbi:hypothetical protein [Pseudoclavibacter helvolus]|uniref:hypothetical protein n=1 Tax=Pseudoclavibacter helvolus TaxID=255205 RepID=UPI0008386658|nr:hypothetical protein [Pseudoclavibacter helvolus]
MSTVDPARMREARAAARVGSPGMRILILLTGVAIVGAAAATIVGALGGMSDQLRYAALSGEFGGSPGVWIYLLMTTGVLASIAAIAGHVITNHATSGNPHRLTGLGATTLWLIGAALGAWAFAPFWTAPETIGAKLDYDGSAVQWSTWEWMLYWVPLAVPIVLSVAATAAAALRLLRLRRLDQVEQFVARLRQRGVTTGGVVTQGIRMNDESVFVSGPWTFRFVDAQGTTPWVRRRGMFRGKNPPLTGERVTVLHDPAHPGDESRIFVARGNPDAPSAFTGHL